MQTIEITSGQTVVAGMETGLNRGDLQMGGVFQGMHAGIRAAVALCINRSAGKEFRCNSPERPLHGSDLPLPLLLPTPKTATIILD